MKLKFLLASMNDDKIVEIMVRSKGNSRGWMLYHEEVWSLLGKSYRTIASLMERDVTDIEPTPFATRVWIEA